MNTEPTPTPELVALLACPFCGSTQRSPIESVVQLSANDDEGRYTVQCDGCTATMGYSDNAEDAIEAWNTRAATVPQGVLDSARLDALGTEISEGGPIVLHNGEGTGGKHRGLGMANTGRTLRQAIDEMCDLNSALSPPPAELGKEKES